MVRKFWIILVAVAVVAFLAGGYSFSRLIRVEIPSVEAGCVGRVTRQEWDDCRAGNIGNYSGFARCVARALCD